MALFEMNFYGIIVLILSILSIGLIYYLYPKRNETVYHYAILFALFCFINFSTQALESLLTNFQLKLIFGQLNSVGFIFIPILWVFLSYAFAHDGKDLAKKYKIILLIIPVFCVIGALTNPLTGWYYSSITNVVDPIAYQLNYVDNWMSYLNIGYAFFSAILSLIILTKATFFSKKIYRKNLLMLLIATIISFIASIFSFLVESLITNLILFIVLGMDMLFYDSLDIMPIINRNVIKDIDIGVSFFDKNNKLLSVNPASGMLSLTEDDLDTSVDEIFKNQKKVLDFYYNDNQNNLEILIGDKWVEVTKKNIVKYDEYLGKEFTIEDVTSKKVELDQKDILIREVHHRVKSNLQIILSLLNIDLRYNNDEPMTVLNDTRVRLNYMSNLHEYVYKQSEFTEVDIKGYLPKIAESIFKMYDSKIEIIEDLTNTIISIDLAIPLGLILTEVITNTIKYAYPENNEGKFIIESSEDNGECTVILSDDGVGLPEGFNVEETNTLGFTIIKSLTQELEGTMKVESDDGVKITLTFPIK